MRRRLQSLAWGEGMQFNMGTGLQIEFGNDQDACNFSSNQSAAEREEAAAVAQIDMVRSLSRRCSIQSWGSFRIRRSSDSAVEDDENHQSRSIDARNAEDKAMEEHQYMGESPPRERPQSDLELMKERFAKLLLGEDMSGGGKASIFGEQGKLAPMAPERKARWRKEMDWLLSVTDHIVEFVPSQQKAKDGTCMEETLDHFGQEKGFWYVSKSKDLGNESSQREGKWWHPVVKVPPNGLSETSRRWLQSEKESVNQVLKAAMAINATVLSEIEVPESYIDSLPKNGRSSLGDSIYKSITVEYFDPAQFLSTMDLSTEHRVLDLKNRIEASMIIWKRKMHHKDGRSSWGSSISLEKRELFEERVEMILHLLKHRFPGLPQSALDVSKIQENKDVGHAILESYSRVIESLAFTIMSRIEDVLHADSLTQTSSPAISSNSDEAAGPSSSETPTLSDFMGWNIILPSRSATDMEIDNDKRTSKPPLSPTPKPSHAEKIENVTSLRNPTDLD
ncbi:hypothetical protein V6N11_055950 [Hibiscus sabdariffa]|uniref:PRONE domain-containing protein n=1 Tax=Hibiscus sabdariffa TaxID=183260 RepID=A0ABR2T381_9ROSI